jgi:hypothetical protein
MNQSVPLWILERHGELHPGPESELPEYGGQQHGIWLHELKSWAELGLPFSELEGTTMASAVGPVPADGGDFLPFLKEFRGIIESSADEHEQIKAIEELGRESSVRRSHLNRLDLPQSWFVRRLGTRLSIGPKTAANLYQAGLVSCEEVQQATDERLLSVAGLGRGTLAKIRSSR